MQANRVLLLTRTNSGGYKTQIFRKPKKKERVSHTSGAGLRKKIKFI